MVATDNVTAAAYINKQGGTHSSSLLEVTYLLYKLVDDLPLAIRAGQIPGTSNVLADSLSRPSIPQATEWMLNPEAFRWVCQRLWTPNLDLFATRFNHQLPVYVSPVPDPAALDLDALAMSWEGIDAYAFPPPILIPRVLQRFRQFHCRLLLIAPRWPNRLWFPDLLHLADPDPLLLPEWTNLLIHPFSRKFQPDPLLFDYTPGFYQVNIGEKRLFFTVHVGYTESSQTIHNFSLQR
jgi:hypothetical protein